MTARPRRAVAVTVILDPLEGKRDEVLELVRDTFAKMRAEQDTLLALTAHVSDDSEQILLYELWSDEDVFDAFLARPEMASYLKRLDERLASRKLSRWTPTSA